MPGMDGTGPMGAGNRRGFGNGYRNYAGRRTYGCGLGYGRGIGYGRGTGFGRGMGFCWRTQEFTREELLAYKENLLARLSDIEKQLQEQDQDQE